MRAAGCLIVAAYCWAICGILRRIQSDVTELNWRVMHYSMQWLTASVTTWLGRRRRQPMTVGSPIAQFVKNYAVSVQFSLVTSLCTRLYACLSVCLS